jgi:N,N'-diacetyllegionaminate synthase
VNRLQQLRRFTLTEVEWTEIFHEASKIGVECFATAFDIESAKWLRGRQKLFKVASGDNDFVPLMCEIASFGCPTLISTGMTDLQDVRKIVDIWGNTSEFGTNNLSLLHCVSSYPVPDDQANLWAIQTLQKEFPNIAIGYSDHCLGIESAIAAVALGACVVEKHFTLDHDLSDFRDHQLSATPDEFQKMVTAIRRVEQMRGSGKLELSPCEEPVEAIARRSIAALRDLVPGETVRSEDLTWLRPGNGFRVGQEAMIEGRQVTRVLQAGEILFPSDLAPPVQEP